MEFKLALTVFGTVLLAELGDKTQLATLLFAAKAPNQWFTVFLAASGALIAASALSVAAGAWLSLHLDPRWLAYAAGIGFIAIGAWTGWQAGSL